MEEMYRQGDILFKKVSTTSSENFTNFGYTKEASGPLVVAQGEATGHHHRVLSLQAEVWRMGGGGNRYLNLKEGAAVTHEEHKALDLPAGIYHIIQQREADETNTGTRVSD